MPFHDSILSCLKDEPLCLDTWYCFPCQVSRQCNVIYNSKRNAINPKICCAALCCCGIRGCFALALRHQVSNKYHLNESTATSCLYALCCPECSVCQTGRELEYQGFPAGGTACKRASRYDRAHTGDQYDEANAPPAIEGEYEEDDYDYYYRQGQQQPQPQPSYYGGNSSSSSSSSSSSASSSSTSPPPPPPAPGEYYQPNAQKPKTRDDQQDSTQQPPPPPQLYSSGTAPSEVLPPAAVTIPAAAAAPAAGAAHQKQQQLPQKPPQKRD